MPRHPLTSAILMAGLALMPAGCSRSAEYAAKDDGGSSASSPADPAEWRGLRDFTAIDATGPDNVIVTTGKDFAVAVEGDPAVIKRLKIKVDGSTLEIGRQRQFGTSWSDDKGVTIRVSMPRIAEISATGSGDIAVNRADGESLKADVTGSGNVTIEAVKLASFEADITGSGNVTVSGVSDTAEISVTGSGNFEGTGLKAGRAKISVLGSGDSALASDGPVDISIMGSGDVTVKGRAQCKDSIMGSGEVRCAP